MQKIGAKIETVGPIYSPSAFNRYFMITPKKRLICGMILQFYHIHMKREPLFCRGTVYI